MYWDVLPEDITKLIWKHRSRQMAIGLLDNQIRLPHERFDSKRLQRIHWAYTLLRPHPDYDVIVQSLLSKTHTWVHYYG